jgi:hypothetical protein
MAYLNAGIIYKLKGELLASRSPDGNLVLTPQSESWFRRSLDFLQRARRIEMAIEEEFRQQDQLHGRARPVLGWYQLHLELGRAYTRLHQPRSALAAYQYALRLRTRPEFFADMAVEWRGAGDLRQAAISLWEGLLFDTNQTAFAGGLVALYGEIDPKGCSLRKQDGSPSVNFACPLVHDDICAASQNLFALYRQKDQSSSAYRVRQSAIADLGCPAERFQ